MEPKKQSKFEDFPSNDDLDFWGDSEVHGNLKPQRFADDDHYFVRTTGREAQCTKCSWGFALDPGDRIKEGHLYTRENKLIV